MRPAAITTVSLLEYGHGMGGIRDVTKWPWTWVRLVTYVKQIKSVYERAALDKDPKTAVPPKWMFFESDALEQWWDERKDVQATLGSTEDTDRGRRVN